MKLLVGTKLWFIELIENGNDYDCWFSFSLFRS